MSDLALTDAIDDEFPAPLVEEVADVWLPLIVAADSGAFDLESGVGAFGEINTIADEYGIGDSRRADLAMTGYLRALEDAIPVRDIHTTFENIWRPQR